MLPMQERSRRDSIAWGELGKEGVKEGATEGWVTEKGNY
jgi:hypothetical protein